MTTSSSERRWVAFTNSPPVRRVMKSSFVRKVRGSRAGDRVELIRLRRRVRAEVQRDPTRFGRVHTVCLLVGHVKSGGSLLGAMLDAHPAILMGDEVDVPRLIQAGFGGEEMLRIFARSSRREAMKGRVTARRLGGYSLAIPGSSQGHSTHPEVVGNARPGPTARMMGDDPSMLAWASRLFPDRRLLFLQVVRHPKDSVAAMVLRSGRDVIEAARDHADQCRRLATLRSSVGDRLLTVHYEQLVEDPVATIRAVLGFLGVEALDDHLRDCAGLIDSDRTPESEQVDWRPEAAEVMAASIASFDFLQPYSAT